jgi:hypothetical protein
MRIDSSGNVGIGAAPTAYSNAQPSLQVKGSNTSNAGHITAITSAADGWLTLFSGTTAADNPAITWQSGGTLRFATTTNPAVAGFTERMRIDSAGKVGIATSSPTDLLTVSGGSIASVIAGSGADIQMGRIAMYSTAFGAAYTNYGGEIRSFCGGGVDVSDLRFYTALGAPTTERMRINSSGSLLVGTTSNSLSGTATTFVVNYSGGATHGCNFNQTVSSATYYTQIAFSTAGTVVGEIRSNNTTTQYNITSDARLKHDIVDAPEASSLIDAIQVRSFKWNEDNSEYRYGFIAQELATVAPEAVSQPEDPDKMMGVDYSKLVPMLIKEVQSLRARVAELEGK